MSVLSAPSDASVDYLRILFLERFGEELPADKIGETQAEVSGSIQTLLREEGQIPASDESKAEILRLSIELGITVVPNATQAGVNRQIRSLTKNATRARFSAGAADFGTFLATLKPSADEEKAGF